MLAASRPDAAAAFVLQAIGWHETARSRGVNVNKMTEQLQQVYYSVVTA